MYREDLDEGDFQETSDREIWLHLAKLDSWGRELPAAGTQKLQKLSSSHPLWQLQEEDRDEFVSWSGYRVGEPPVPDVDEFLTLDDESVVARLAAEPLKDGDLERWSRLVVDQPDRASSLLGRLANAGAWRGEIWRSALENFAARKTIIQQWPVLTPLLETAPDSLIGDIIAPLAWALEEVAVAAVGNEDFLFWNVWDRAQPHAFVESDRDFSDPLSAALNTPAGHLTQALFAFVAALRPNRGSDLAPDIWRRLTEITKGTGQPFTLARVLLASRLVGLHNLDPAWTEEQLLPHFDWRESAEAPAVWRGFLWQPRVTPELWPRIKGYFLDALREKRKLENAQDQICRLFGAICIDIPEWLTDDGMRTVLRSLDARGRAVVARVVWKRLEGSGARSEVLWRDQVGPWLERVWPKDLAMKDPDSSLNLAMAATYAGDSFASAVETVSPLLTGAEHVSLLIKRLLDIEIADREPLAVLQLVALVVDPNRTWPDPELGELLDKIVAADPSTKDRPEFRDLDEYLRRHNL